ncbi:acetolactate decarboxylase, partial [Legionella jordanis]|uniref:acetolactate decarboxylase n=1 Tax=Legionella jordanis TaxID=456 RepID=UPI001C822276
ACFNIDRIWLSLNFDFFMQNLLAHTLRENSTFGINYFVGGLPDKNIISKNYIYAYRFTSIFDEIECRSEACQPQPYRPLTETFPKVQVNFSYKNIHGVIAGFRFPEYFSAFNVPGHHMHFLNPEEMKGGHVFQCRFQSAKISLCMIKHYELSLIDSEAFRQLDIGAEELKAATHAIEQQTKS